MTNLISHPCRHGSEAILCLQCHRDEIEKLRAENTRIKGRYLTLSNRLAGMAALQETVIDLETDEVDHLERNMGKVTTVGGIEKFPVGGKTLHIDLPPPGVLSRCKTCGHEAGFTHGPKRGQSDNFTVGVECTNTSCGIRTPVHYRDEANAAIAWNRTPTVE